MDKRDSKTNRSAIIAAFSVIAILAIGYFYISPNIGALKTLNIQVDAKIAEITKYNDNVSALNVLKSQLAQISDQLNKLGLAVPSNDDMPDALTQIESMANNSGLKVNSIQPGKESTGIVPITVNLKGDYIGLANFITKLEKNIRPANIKSINIASASGENNLLNITMNMNMLKSGGASEQK